MSGNNALSLLSSTYLSSDSSDDEIIPGPRVSCKRRTPKNWIDENVEKKTKLPLPSALTTLFPVDCDTDEVVDDPSQHDGRIRSFAHERGNWSTYVFIPYYCCPAMETLISTIITECKTLTILKPIDELHISLTRTVILRHHWIDLFVESLRECLNVLHSFQVLFESVEVYCNEEKTRTFIGLKVPQMYLPPDLISLIDKCLAEFRLPPFYSNPSLHMSVAWCVGNYVAELQTLLPGLQQIVFEKFVCAYPNLLTLDVEHLVCKTGNKRFTFPLVK